LSKMHPLVSLGNGVELQMEGRAYAFDPRRVEPSRVNMVSHAHSDHLPSSMRGGSVMCSPITMDVIRSRRKRPVEGSTDASVEALPAGHTFGSLMFMVRGEGSVLYTGDMCTRRKGHLEPARPASCDVLVMESTFGRPGYVFPPHDDVISAARDWLDDAMRHDRSVVVHAYPFGKSQELACEFSDLPLRMSAGIASVNRMVAAHGVDLPCDELDDTERPPYVYITSGMGSESERVRGMVRRGARTCAFSGWALDGTHAARMGADASFPLSDHSGFDELMGFVKGCSPDVVFTTHGFSEDLAENVRSSLGIDAFPLSSPGQTFVEQFL
jgi:putative mRNA 3-end processing factor